MPAKKPAKPAKKTQRPAKRASLLEKYAAKRDFRHTPEPAGGEFSAAGNSFVIQEHHARSHHFDFRLEMDGVLASWAVPKGIPEDPADRRLAIHVEDHPLEYGKFEGEIPAGNYGAGTVAIHDCGTWSPLGKNWRAGFSAGKLKFTLAGQKLRGTWVLTRMEEPNWLLRFLNAETPGAPPAAMEAEVPAFISPQLAAVSPAVPSGQGWQHELKLDGYRIIAVRDGKSIRLFTRSGLDWTEKFPALAGHLARLTPKQFTLDGEAVVFDAKGRTSFGMLQEELKTPRGGNISYVAFDLLNLGGKNFRSLPLRERAKKLAEIIPASGPVRVSEIWPENHGAELFKQACELGLEGIISKKSAGIYRPGTRVDWLKSKCRARQEFIICGYTEPKASCPAFGALVLGSMENHRLVFRGKVGTGFSDEARRTLLVRMKKIVTSKPPAGFPTMREVTWIRPEIIAEVEFAEITRDGSIRQGNFISLRGDKSAEDIRLDAIPAAAADEENVLIRRIHISHPGRVVFPKDGITKYEVAEYYGKHAEFILPHVKSHPLAIVRAPDGIGGGMFFQKSFKGHVPEGVIPATLGDGTEVFTIRNAEGLVSLAQFGMVEIHPWGAPLPEGDFPDKLIWDLDPDAAVPWKEVQGAALFLRDFLAERNLRTILKTSGGKGLHVVLPLRKKHGWDVLKPFARAVAEAAATFFPHRFIVKADKKQRAGKIFIDWLRNGRGATCVVPWGLRARDGAPVSAPILWDDLPGTGPADFSIRAPAPAPDEWVKPPLQSITKAHLAEFR